MNPVCGSAGLVTSGSWNLCEAAVEAVLRGQPIKRLSNEPSSKIKACDIRHVAKGESSAGSDRLLRKVQSPSKFKRSASKRKAKVEVESETEFGTESMTFGDSAQLGLSGPSASHDSEETRRLSRGAESGEEDSGSVGSLAKPKPRLDDRAGLSEAQLELTLGFGVWISDEIDRCDGATCREEISY